MECYDGVTKLEEVEDRLYKEQIVIVNYPMQSSLKSFCLRKGHFKIICIDESKIGSKKEKRCILEHEYEHLKEYNLMYQLDECSYRVRRTERRVSVRLIKRLIPLDKLKPLLKAQKPLWEIAEELEVTEALLRQAIAYYQDLEVVVSSEDGWYYGSKD